MSEEEPFSLKHHQGPDFRVSFGMFQRVVTKQTASAGHSVITLEVTVGYFRASAATAYSRPSSSAAGSPLGVLHWTFRGQRHLL